MEQPSLPSLSDEQVCDLIVERYRSLGIKAATGTFNMTSSDGSWRIDDPERGCCVIAALILDKPADKDYMGQASAIIGREIGWPFVRAFDHALFMIKAEDMDSQQVKLGLAIRERLVSEGLL